MILVEKQEIETGVMAETNTEVLGHNRYKWKVTTEMMGNLVPA